MRVSSHKLIATCLVAVVLFVPTWAIRPLPNPMQDECGRGRKSWLCDPENLLTEPQRQQVERALEKIRDKVSPNACGKGYQVRLGSCGVSLDCSSRLRQPQFGMGVISTVLPYGARVSDSGIKRLAKATHDAWGVGFEGCQTGLLLVLAIDDRKVCSPAAIALRTATHVRTHLPNYVCSCSCQQALTLERSLQILTLPPSVSARNPCSVRVAWQTQ